MNNQIDTDRRALLKKSVLASGALSGRTHAGGALDAQSTAAPLPDMVRRVVSSNNAQGKSYVSKDEMIKRDHIWSTKDGEIFGPVTGTDTAKPQPPIVSKNLPDGATQAYFFSIGPSTGPLDRATIKDWHRDDSIVYIYFVAGEVTWLSETDQAILGAGDVLVQRNANHTWHNAGTIPASGFAVKIRV